MKESHKWEKGKAKIEHWHGGINLKFWLLGPGNMRTKSSVLAQGDDGYWVKVLVAMNDNLTSSLGMYMEDGENYSEKRILTSKWCPLSSENMTYPVYMCIHTCTQ